MLMKKFAAPCRVNYVPSPYEPDEDGVMDVGYKNGVMSKLLTQTDIIFLLRWEIILRIP